jgi:hypothetical protein
MFLLNKGPLFYYLGLFAVPDEETEKKGSTLIIYNVGPIKFERLLYPKTTNYLSTLDKARNCMS